MSGLNNLLFVDLLLVSCFLAGTAFRSFLDRRTMKTLMTVVRVEAIRLHQVVILGHCVVAAYERESLFPTGQWCCWMFPRVWCCCLRCDTRVCAQKNNIKAPNHLWLVGIFLWVLQFSSMFYCYWTVFPPMCSLLQRCCYPTGEMRQTSYSCVGGTWGFDPRRLFLTDSGIIMRAVTCVSK